MLAKQPSPKACAAHRADITLLFFSAHKRILFCNFTSRILVLPSVLEVLTCVNACNAFISDAVKLYWRTVKSQRCHPQFHQSAIPLFCFQRTKSSKKIFFLLGYRKYQRNVEATKKREKLQTEMLEPLTSMLTTQMITFWWLLGSSQTQRGIRNFSFAESFVVFLKTTCFWKENVQPSKKNLPSTEHSTPIEEDRTFYFCSSCAGAVR